MNFSADSIENTPAFVVDEDLLIKNLEILGQIREQTGVKILLALKGFAMHSLAPRIMKYLDGVTASGVNEACLGAEFFKKEVHVYSPGFRENEIKTLVSNSDHIIFNSLAQFRALHCKFKSEAKKQNKTFQLGIRVNHGYSEVEIDLYNPCIKGSRFGVLANELENISEIEWASIDGLHFHTMCEQGADVLERTVKVIEAKVSQYFKYCSFINLGGGHHITRPGYDLKLLTNILETLNHKYSCQLYLEPGEAIALNTGFLVSTVVDIVHNGMDIAILDTSATAHMPDIIEMPYRAEIIGAGEPEQKAHNYRLGGLTCLAGDVIGDYSFDSTLRPGDKLVFTDMAHYTMVKTTQFNGMNLPDIGYIESKTRDYKIVRTFGYADYKNLLS